jgi:hypothetical protein
VGDRTGPAAASIPTPAFFMYPPRPHRSLRTSSPATRASRTCATSKARGSGARPARAACRCSSRRTAASRRST